MSTFADLLNKARDVADVVGAKTGELVDKTKVKMEIASVEKKLSAAFEGIGRLVYEADNSGEDISALKAEAFETVKILQAEREALQTKLYDFEGAVRCQNCETVNEGDAMFCKNCGKTL